MIEKQQNEYLPDEVSPPGETLAETLEELGMSQAQLAQRMGRPHKTINEIVNGKTAITPETAIQLERVLGVPARFWLKREQHYQEWRARQQDETHLRTELDWLQQLPVEEMIKLGWISAGADPIERMRTSLSFFGVASPDQWRQVWQQPKVSFRHTQAFTSEPGAVVAWLRKGQLEAQAIACAPYDAQAFRRVLQQVRALTLEPTHKILDDVRRLCATAGVAVVVVPSLTKCRASGATAWLAPTKAMLLLCLRYRTDDQFWFSFFHEAGHILLHGKREVFLDEEVGIAGKDEDDATSSKEQEADAFAAELLVPARALRKFAQAHHPYFSKENIRAFARQQGIAPGIVVGRLQHKNYLPYSHCNDLKAAVGWETMAVEWKGQSKA